VTDFAEGVEPVHVGLAPVEEGVAGLGECGLDDRPGLPIGVDVEMESSGVVPVELAVTVRFGLELLLAPAGIRAVRVTSCRVVAGRGFTVAIVTAGHVARVVADRSVARFVGRISVDRVSVGVGDVGERVAGQHASELGDGHRGAVAADLLVGPPWCSFGDRGHLIDGQFAATERRHTDR
jgi:hypothetical protein